jgi:hypothetical protein
MLSIAGLPGMLLKTNNRWSRHAAILLISHFSDAAKK